MVGLLTAVLGARAPWLKEGSQARVAVGLQSGVLSGLRGARPHSMPKGPCPEKIAEDGDDGSTA